MRPVVVTSRWQPHSIFFLIYATALGGNWLAAGRPVDPPLSALPGWAVPVWYGALSVGGIVGLAAAAVPSRWYGLALIGERIAMYATGAGIAIYAVLVLDLGWRMWVSVLLLIFWALANGWRIIQIHATLRQLRNRDE